MEELGQGDVMFSFTRLLLPHFEGEDAMGWVAAFLQKDENRNTQLRQRVFLHLLEKRQPWESSLLRLALAAHMISKYQSIFSTPRIVAIDIYAKLLFTKSESST